MHQHPAQGVGGRRRNACCTVCGVPSVAGGAGHRKEAGLHRQALGGPAFTGAHPRLTICTSLPPARCPPAVETLGLQDAFRQVGSPSDANFTWCSGERGQAGAVCVRGWTARRCMQTRWWWLVRLRRVGACSPAAPTLALVALLPALPLRPSPFHADRDSRANLYYGHSEAAGWRGERGLCGARGRLRQLALGSPACACATLSTAILPSAPYPAAPNRQSAALHRPLRPYLPAGIWGHPASDCC